MGIDGWNQEKINQSIRRLDALEKRVDALEGKKENTQMMRAKLKVAAVVPWEGGTGESLTFLAVAKNDGYPEDGSDENNTYARWTPTAELKMSIQNPNLIGKFAVGQEFYVDFTPAK